MEHQLSFATIYCIQDNIAEVVINPNVLITLEMAEEYDNFLAKLFTQDFAILVNKINPYELMFEAQYTIASHENLKAIAVINYGEAGEKASYKLAQLRQVDGWNLRSFSGGNLGRQEGIQWLEQELSTS